MDWTSRIAGLEARIRAESRRIAAELLQLPPQRRAAAHACIVAQLARTGDGLQPDDAARVLASFEQPAPSPARPWPPSAPVAVPAVAPASPLGARDPALNSLRAAAVVAALIGCTGLFVLGPIAAGTAANALGLWMIPIFDGGAPLEYLRAVSGRMTRWSWWAESLGLTAALYISIWALRTLAERSGSTGSRGLWAPAVVLFVTAGMICDVWGLDTARGLPITRWKGTLWVDDGTEMLAVAEPRASLAMLLVALPDFDPNRESCAMARVGWFARRDPVRVVFAPTEACKAAFGRHPGLGEFLWLDRAARLQVPQMEFQQEADGELPR